MTLKTCDHPPRLDDADYFYMIPDGRGGVLFSSTSHDEIEAWAKRNLSGAWHGAEKRYWCPKCGDYCAVEKREEQGK